LGGGIPLADDADAHGDADRDAHCNINPYANSDAQRYPDADRDSD